MKPIYKLQFYFYPWQMLTMFDYRKFLYYKTIFLNYRNLGMSKRINAKFVLQQCNNTTITYIK